MCKNVRVTLIRRYQGIIFQPSLSNQDQLLKTAAGTATSHFTKDNINQWPGFLLTTQTQQLDLLLPPEKCLEYLSQNLSGVKMCEALQTRPPVWPVRGIYNVGIVSLVLQHPSSPNTQSRGPLVFLQIDFKRMPWSRWGKSGSRVDISLPQMAISVRFFCPERYLITAIAIPAHNTGSLLARKHWAGGWCVVMCCV